MNREFFYRLGIKLDILKEMTEGEPLVPYNGTKQRCWTITGQRVLPCSVEYLVRKELIQEVGNGFYEITDLGRRVVEMAPLYI